MPKNDIGGFFVSLGLQPDKNSFETGNKLIDAVSTSLNKLIGTARNAAVVLAGTAVASGAVESANYKTATAIGISTEKLDVWKASAKIAGVNADGLVGSMGKLANVMNHMTIDGSGLEAYEKQLGELGMGFDKLEGLDPADAYAKILEVAQSKLDGTNMTRITTIVGDILGSEGQNLFIELTRQGKTIGEFLTGAQKTVFTNAADNEAGANFATEVNTLKTELESIAKLTGDKVGGILTPYLRDINDWIQNNADNIKSTVEKISSTTEKIIGKSVDAIGKWWEQNGDTIVEILTGLASTVSLILGKLLGVLNNKVVKSIGSAWTSAFEEAATAVPNMVKGAKEGGVAGFGKAAWESFKGVMFNPLASLFGGEMNDGIMRPDGTITRVAPDDWVFAARNVGDLAKAFIPQGITTNNGNNEFVINQTITINGGSDIPQVVREQAYNGVQEGLLAVMNQSSQRLQMMSGTR